MCDTPSISLSFFLVFLFVPKKGPRGRAGWAESVNELELARILNKQLVLTGEFRTLGGIETSDNEKRIIVRLANLCTKSCKNCKK